MNAIRTHARAVARRRAAVALAAVLSVGVLSVGSAELTGPVSAVRPDVVGDTPQEARAVEGAVGQSVAPTFPEADKGPMPPGHVAKSLWWAWTAPASGPVTFTTAGSEMDTELTVSLASADGEVVASNDDAG